MLLKNVSCFWISLVIRWLRLHVSNAGGMGSIPDQGTKIPHAVGVWPKKKKKFRVLALISSVKCPWYSRCLIG